MIKIKKFDEPQVNKREILRYMGCKDVSADMMDLVDSCLKETNGIFTFKVAYDYFDINTDENCVDLGFISCKSKGLRLNLSQCHKALIFAATIGIGIDRLIAKYSRISPSKALCFQAIGAERIESLCDLFNKEITEEANSQNLFTRPRFSPGYGDLSLDIQKNIFEILDCPRKIGLSLNESLLMSPSKSVTAIIGISDKPKHCSTSGCSECSKTDCNFRRNNL